MLNRLIGRSAAEGQDQTAAARVRQPHWRAFLMQELAHLHQVTTTGTQTAGAATTRLPVVPLATISAPAPDSVRRGLALLEEEE